MKKILFCLPLLLLALQSCEIEDEYMYDKGLYTIDWDAAADSSFLEYGRELFQLRE